MEERLENCDKLCISLHPCSAWTLGPIKIESEDEPKFSESNLTPFQLKYFLKKSKADYR